ncbi:hypothetical protein FA15DRAFT_263986 [Coprinopsis marcescibilis]|uniref:RNA polymerase II subunit A C-terminal domain phosphatase n=1 Tax=Coprinopsis marcescibilis TaxID=230819 RepID=A0A5C3L1I0_COPMA|nr:hypothetical protein FA15DRAFT_263986 [Coprinopsis marcescibilis]
MESDPTDLYLPEIFPYPLTIVSLDTPVNSEVQRGTRLLSYSFVYVPKDQDSKPETRFGTWDSSVEGSLASWKVKVGDIITRAKATARPVAVVIEPCKHSVQVGGLCVVCAKDMTSIDYTGFSDASRASIQMTHSAFGPTVSMEEAQRIERETADHLLKSRKLSLIVDLDQTIVHATVDPTVGEWISEGEAWEARQAARAAKRAKASAGGEADSDDSDSSDSSDDEDDECNPNWDALKDVKKFRLGPESFGYPPSRGSRSSKGKYKAVETEGCLYYIKARPGWKEFLEEASKKYEMHVYTMGTRAYAEQVCAAIDPDKKIFGNRLLSRDESGSLTQKSIQRLFPCDTSMVVIIDDRADVWEWSPNLIKVIPYDFFVGIGDINSTFLPKVDSASLIATPIKPLKPQAVPSEANGTVASKAASDKESKDDTDSLVTINNAALDAQLEERPLAKKEKELQEHEAAAEQPSPTPSRDSATPSPTPETHSEHHHRKALLKNDDTELDRVAMLLDEVHERFFTAYDIRSPETNRRRMTSKKRPYDVTRIIPKIRAETLEGCHILFSGLIPLDTNPESTEIWRSATMFGAVCHTELNSKITHVVAAKLGTVKVDQARKRGNIAIVTAGWLSNSIAYWHRADETQYLLEDPTPTAPGSSMTSKQPKPQNQQAEQSLDDDTDDDSPQVQGGAPSSLQLNDIDWDDLNNEVNLAMEESDDEDDSKSTKSAVSEGDYADDVSIASATSSPRLKRKRLRSATPSDIGPEDRELLRSPLAKRKKIALERSGLSRLKEGVTAFDLVSETGSPEPIDQDDQDEEAGDYGYEHNDDDEDDDLEEVDPYYGDFLAEELEESWS